MDKVFQFYINVIGTVQWFSNFNVHHKYLESLFKNSCLQFLSIMHIACDINQLMVSCLNFSMVYEQEWEKGLCLYI